MHDVPIPSEMAHDPRELNAPGRGLGRDPFRTPMQWTAGGGFTDGEPWLPIADDAATLNVETERSQAGSMLSLYRRLLELRAAEPALSVGSYAPLPASGDLLAFTRRFEGRQLLVAMTLAPGAGSVDLAGRAGRVLLSSNGDREGEAVAGTLDVGPDEALVLELNGAA